MARVARGRARRARASSGRVEQRVEAVRAARLEAAAGRRREQRRRRARDRRRAGCTRGRPTRGIEPSSPHVYGCCGSRKTADFGPSSTTPPAYMTMTRSASPATDAHVVRDEQDRRAVVALQPLHQLEDLRLDRHVERGRRLVGDQQRRVARERHRDHHALPHAARELVRVVVDRGAPGSGCRPRRAARPSRARACRRVSCSCARSCSAICQPTVYTGVSAVIGSWKIIAISPPRTARISLAGELHQVAAAVEHLPLDDRVRIADQPHHGHHRDGLAGARLADDADDLAERDREREPVDGAHEPVLGPERDAAGRGPRAADRLRHDAPAGRARIDEVDDGVRDDDEERGVDDGRQDHRQVEVLQRVEGQLADARAARTRPRSSSAPPPTSAPKSSPKRLTNAISDVRSACRKSTRRSVSPFARAVRT